MPPTLGLVPRAAVNVLLDCMPSFSRWLSLMGSKTSAHHDNNVHLEGERGGRGGKPGWCIICEYCVSTELYRNGVSVHEASFIATHDMAVLEAIACLPCL